MRNPTCSGEADQIYLQSPPDNFPGGPWNGSHYDYQGYEEEPERPFIF